MVDPKAETAHFLLYKPYGMLSQFTREAPNHVTLADVDFHFPKDAYPVGRLDADSEGLLLLTNDKSLNKQLLDPSKKHPRTYWVQVEGIPDEAAVERLRRGVDIPVGGKKHRTLPAGVRLLTASPELPARVPPIRIRKSIPDTWIEITLIEGKNRQVRRMCAAVGFPVLRLVRVQIGGLGFPDQTLEGMRPGEVRVLDENFLKLLLQ